MQKEGIRSYALLELKESILGIPPTRKPDIKVGSSIFMDKSVNIVLPLPTLVKTIFGNK
jgi:hypothetical protein